MGNVGLSIRLGQKEPAGGESDSQFVETDKFHAGEYLTGELLVDVQQRVCRGAQVTLHAFGYEKTAVTTGKKNQRIHRNERVFFQASTTLGKIAWKRPTSEESNKYCFPFSILLPENLPCTFSHGTFEHGCMIRYVVRAQVGKSQSCREFFLVSAPLPNVVLPSSVEPHTETLKSLGVKRIGSVTFRAGVTDTQIGRGGEIELSLACQNNSTAKIEQVNIKVVELVSWNVKLRQKQQTKNVLASLTDLKLPGLATDGHRAGVDAHSRNYEPILSSLRSLENVIRVEIPTSANDTYCGRIMSVTHYIKVYLQTKRFSRNLSTKIPLLVGNPSRVAGQSGHSQEPAAPRHVENLSERSTTPREMQSASPALEEEAIWILTPPAPSAPPEDDENTYIPVATVVPVPLDVSHGGFYALPESAVDGMEDTEVFGRRSSTAERLDPVSPNPPGSARPSLANLLREMEASMNHHQVLSKKLDDPRWKRLLKSLRPKGFGSIIACTTDEFDQPRVAKLLARHIGDGFTCAHCISALKNTARWNRITVVQQLLLLCHDLDVHRDVIWAELNPWEQTVTARVFASASSSSDVLGGMEDTEVVARRSSAAKPVSVPPPASTRPSLTNLLQEMKASMNHYEFLSKKLYDPQWNPQLKSLRPKAFGSIIAHITEEFDQPRVAKLLARSIGDGFTCAHCVSALTRTASWNRITVVQQLLPLCQDVGEHGNAIKAKLNPWEQTVTARDFAVRLVS